MACPMACFCKGGYNAFVQIAVPDEIRRCAPSLKSRPPGLEPTEAQ